MKYKKELENYEKYLLEKELAEQTRKIYLTQVDKFLEYIHDRPITKAETIAYKKILLTQGKKLSTINLKLMAVNGFLRYAGYADSTVKIQKQQSRPLQENLLTVEEYRKMLIQAKESGREKYYYIMRTLALTGIRVSELVGCTVEAMKTGRFIVCNKGKSRDVFLPEKLVAELQEYCRSNAITEGVIFRGNDDGPITRIAVYKMIVRLADELGLPKGSVHPHSFRHLFAVTYMKQYSNLFELADILGHSSLETTRIYTATTGAERRKKMNQLEL